jgi:hypothetical protein
MRKQGRWLRLLVERFDGRMSFALRIARVNQGQDMHAASMRQGVLSHSHVIAVVVVLVW